MADSEMISGTLSVVGGKRLLRLDVSDSRASDARLTLDVSEAAYLGVLTAVRSHRSQGNADTVLRALANIIESADRPAYFDQ